MNYSISLETNTNIDSYGFEETIEKSDHSALFPADTNAKAEKVALPIVMAIGALLLAAVAVAGIFFGQYQVTVLVGCMASCLMYVALRTLDLSSLSKPKKVNIEPSTSSSSSSSSSTFDSDRFQREPTPATSYFPNQFNNPSVSKGPIVEEMFDSENQPVESTARKTPVKPSKLETRVVIRDGKVIIEKFDPNKREILSLDKLFA